ncbi:hypothetical protein FRC02_005417 [Tulasnella sp. 418]|nr:hypothetical protein FRC02_005417 [Tulasnella sp. 418]
MDSTSVSTTLLHSITFMLAPLAPHFPPQTLDALHLSLLSALSHLDLSTTHSFLFSPSAPAPLPVRYALASLAQFPPHLRVAWNDWVILLTHGHQIILNITAGLVTANVIYAQTGTTAFSTIWDATAVVHARAPSPWGSSSRSRSSAPSSADSASSRSSTPVSEPRESPVTQEPVVAVAAAENVLKGWESDEEEVFVYKTTPAVAPLNHRRQGSWLPDSLPAPAAAKPLPRPAAPKAAALRAQHQQHSRSSSRSSVVSSAPSLSSSVSSSLSLEQTLSNLSITEPSSPTPSCPSSDEEDTCYIDATKDQNSVTVYECGKVGVLTGAVMLGVPKGATATKTTKAKMTHRKGASTSSPTAWRKNVVGGARV